MTRSPALLRTFLAHVAATAEIATPPMHSGLHEDVVDFLAVTALYADSSRRSSGSSRRAAISG